MSFYDYPPVTHFWFELSPETGIVAYSAQVIVVQVAVLFLKVVLYGNEPEL